LKIHTDKKLNRNAYGFCFPIHGIQFALSLDCRSAWKLF